MKNCKIMFIFNKILNFVEYKHNFTILHYILISLDLQSLQILLNAKVLEFIDGNIQDNSGNIFYHYFISNIINLKKLDSESIDKITNINKICEKINFSINLFKKYSSMS